LRVNDIQMGMEKRQLETMTKGVRACDGQRHNDDEAGGLAGTA
jgi:hypothetical protein